MRRTAATWMQDEGGFAKDDVHAVLGHSLGELQATYMAGPGYRRKKAALQAWADYVYAAVEGKTEDKVVRLRSGGRADADRALQGRSPLHQARACEG